MILQTLRRVFEGAGERPLFIGPGGATSYAEWLELVAHTSLTDLSPGDVVALRMEPTAVCCATLWALLERGAIVGLLGPADDLTASCTLLGASSSFDAAGRQQRHAPPPEPHPLCRQLATAGHAGLVLLSSGTTGVPKAALHDVERLFAKFEQPGRDLRTLLFLPPSHIGGLDTLLYAMSNASALVVAASRSVEDVCRAIAQHRVEVLATNPSFLRLLLLQRGNDSFDLTSLRVITFGAEVMPQTVLDQLRTEFPHVSLRQKYGSTELGALKTRTRGDGSLWLEPSGDIQLRIIEGRLHVRTGSTMLGYLNAASPISEDGWVDTGDRVEQDGTCFRILGRASDLINVGGEKVFPSEVEDTLLQMPGVQDVLAYGEPNALLGQVVSVEIVYAGVERDAQLSALVRRYCKARLAPFKVPMRVRAVASLAMGPQKKLRPAQRAVEPRG